MRLPPVEVIYHWPTPNYDHPTTRGNALLVVNAIFIGLVIVIVSLRLYTRLVIKRWFGLDDIFILLALVRMPQAARTEHQSNEYSSLQSVSPP